MSTEVVLDFETTSKINLKKAGAYRYAEDPSTQVICLCYQVDAGEVHCWRPTPLEGNPTALELLARDPTMIFVAHGSQFEKAIWRKIMVPRYGFSDKPNKYWDDTMAECAMKALPLGLGDVAKVLRLPNQKDTEYRGLLKRVDKGDWSEPTIDGVIKGCRMDVLAERDVHTRVGALTEGERKVWLLDQRINERGVRLDMAFVAKAQEVIDKASRPMLAEFAEITGGLKPTQRDRFKDWLTIEGVDVPDLKKDTIEALLGRDEEDDDEQSPDAEDPRGGEDTGSDDVADPVDLSYAVRRALGIRRVLGSASIKKLQRMRDCVCADGRARGLVQYHAASTGRFGGRILQPHNFPIAQIMTIDGRGREVPLDPSPKVDAIMTGDPDYVAAMIGDPVETVISSLRHALVPERDRLFVAGDFKGVEARILYTWAGAHRVTVMMHEGKDVYADLAAEIYGYPINKIEHPVERDIGKHGVLGMGYGLGWRSFGDRYAPDASDEFLKSAVSAYREEWVPEVPEFWYALQDAAVRCVWDRVPTNAFGIEYRLVDSWLTARLPSGRRLWYYAPRPERDQMPWNPAIVRPGFSYQAKKMGRWVTVHAHGGLLTGQAVQGLARDLLVPAMFKCEREDMPVVLTVHDEIVTEPTIDKASVETLSQIMEDIPSWAKQLGFLIAVDPWVGDRYRK